MCRKLKFRPVLQVVSEKLIFFSCESMENYIQKL